jgi:hypothetical protein
MSDISQQLNKEIEEFKTENERLKEVIEMVNRLDKLNEINDKIKSNEIEIRNLVSTPSGVQSLERLEAILERHKKSTSDTRGYDSSGIDNVERAIGLYKENEELSKKRQHCADESKAAMEYHTLSIKQNDAKIKANEEIIKITNGGDDFGYIEIDARDEYLEINPEESLEDKIKASANAIVGQIIDGMKQELIQLNLQKTLLELDIKKVQTGIMDIPNKHVFRLDESLKKNNQNEIAPLNRQIEPLNKQIQSLSEKLNDEREKLNDKQGIRTQAIGKVIKDTEGELLKLGERYEENVEEIKTINNSAVAGHQSAKDSDKRTNSLEAENLKLCKQQKLLTEDLIAMRELLSKEKQVGSFSKDNGGPSNTEGAPVLATKEGHGFLNRLHNFLAHATSGNKNKKKPSPKKNK